MKKLLRLSFIALVVVSAILSACQGATTTTLTGTATSTTTTTAMVTTTTIVTHCILNDFYIIYETSWFGGKFMTLLDTDKNIIGKQLSKTESVSTAFYIPCEDLQLIYNAIIEYDIKSLSGLGALLTEGYVIPPRTDSRITFRLGAEVYSVTFNTSAYAYSAHAGENLWAFQRIIFDYCMNTDEYKSFPPGEPLI